jgi:hypothetical protein
VDLGNTVTATRNLFFQPREDIGTQLGLRAYDAYAIKQDEVQYVDTRSQHTELDFISGGKKHRSAHLPTPKMSIHALILAFGRKGLHPISSMDL